MSVWFRLCVSVSLISWSVHKPLVFGGTCEERSAQLPHPLTEGFEENKGGQELENQLHYSDCVVQYELKVCFSSAFLSFTGAWAVSLWTGGAPHSLVLFNPPKSEWVSFIISGMSIHSLNVSVGYSLHKTIQWFYSLFLPAGSSCGSRLRRAAGGQPVVPKVPGLAWALLLCQQTPATYHPSGAQSTRWHWSSYLLQQNRQNVIFSLSLYLYFCHY